MTDPLERLVNLAMCLASSGEAVRWDRVREVVPGYPEGQDTDAFLRMFERDKEHLRAAGLEIEVVEGDGGAAYRVDVARTYGPSVRLAPDEIAALRAVGWALASDEGFPYPEDLRLALAKLLPEIGEAPAAATRVADEAPGEQGRAVASLTAAAETRKRVSFAYVNALGEDKAHEVEPYGLFLRDGRWYLVGRDARIDEVRVYAVARIRALEVETSRPKSPDFERPEDFDVRRYAGLPFQYGPGEVFEARIRFSPVDAWRANGLAGDAGRLTEEADGSLLWSVEARDARRLAQWVVENGPGLTLEGPVGAVEALRAGLAEAVAAHD